LHTLAHIRAGLRRMADGVQNGGEGNHIFEGKFGQGYLPGTRQDAPTKTSQIIIGIWQAHGLEKNGRERDFSGRFSFLLS
jgi:hypothetical protein